MDVLRKEFERWNVYFYHIAMLLLMASIPLSKYTTSAFQFVTLGFWLLYKSDITYIEDFIQKKGSLISKLPVLILGFFISLYYSLISKFRLFFRNRLALLITSLLLLHVLGLIYTSDFQYAFKDLRTKLPLLLLPLFFSTGPKVNNITLRWLYLGYATAILGGTIYRLILFKALPVADPRAIASHISHIRFSLNVTYSIFILMYFVVQRDLYRYWHKAIFLVTAAWFLFFMIYLRYSTGIAILLIVTFILLIIRMLEGSRLRTKLLLFSALLILAAIPTIVLISRINEYRHTKPVNFSHLEKYTAGGNSYYHDTVNFRIENSRYIGLYICDKELRRAWSIRSSHPIDSLDGKGQALRFTLIRYLASKDLRKDSAGIASLSRQDIRNIEAGLTNANSRKVFNIETQVDNLLTGWDNYIHHHNPNSSSLIQRVEYWRSSISLITQHPIFGVGTGDVPSAFKEYYDSTHSRLKAQFRLRSHNQYLSIAIAFGLIGLAWFLYVIIYPMVATRKYQDYYYLVFWLIFIISMLTEDTIETQEGVTFFSFFTSLLLFARKENSEDRSEKQLKANR